MRKIKNIILIPLILFLFFTMYYWDNQTIFVNVLSNTSAILQGNWQKLFNGWGLPYGILMQIACAIWTLPILILSNLGLTEAVSVGARLWYKFFVLLFLFADTKQLENIARKIGISEERISWLKLYFLSSFIVILPAVHVAQLDAVYLFFVLLGISYYIDGKHFLFLLCFAVANPSKYFPLFVFIPLVLLNEKRHLYIIRDFAIGGAGFVFDRLVKSIGYRLGNSTVFDNAESGIEALKNTQSFVDNSISRFLESDFSLFSAPVSIVFVFFFVLCVWCYTRKIQDKIEKSYCAVYSAFLGFLILFSFGAVTPYWIILLAPFELLLIFKGTDETDKLLIPLEIAMGVAFVYITLQTTAWIYGSEETFNMLVFSLIPGYVDAPHGYIKDFLTQHGIDGFSSVMCAVMAVTSIVLTYMAYPKKEVERPEIEETNIYVKGWYWVRVAALYVWILLNIYVVAMGKI